MTEQQHRRRTLDAVQAVVDSNPDLVKRRARYDLAQRVLRALVITCVLLTTGLLIYLAAGANNAANAIRDCTTPGGKCYQDGEKRTAAAVGQIVKAQQAGIANGSKPAQQNLVLTKANADNIALILATLQQQYPQAAAAARAELIKEGVLK